MSLISSPRLRPVAFLGVGALTAGLLLAAGPTAAATACSDPSTVALADAAQCLPPDMDPNTPGLQVSVPQYNEPESYLSVGGDRWDIRNTPAGTVAAAYGHTTNADEAAFSQSARYSPVSETPVVASSAQGAVSGSRQPLDVSTLAPSGFRSGSWIITRYDDGSLEFEGPLENAGLRRYVLGPATGTGWVGGTVVNDSSSPKFLAVRSDGQVFTATVSGSAINLVSSYTLPAAAAAAVSKTSSVYSVAPMLGTQTFDGPALQASSSGSANPVISTFMVVWLQNGDFIPFAIGQNGVEVTKLNSFNATFGGPFTNFFKATPPTTNPVTNPTTFKFDFSCTLFDSSSTGNVFTTGTTATMLGCPPGAVYKRTNYQGTSTRYFDGLGRLSIAVPQIVNNVGTVNVLTGDDAEVNANGTWSVKLEYGADAACSYPGASTVPFGSFDVRAVLAVTHAACVQVDPAVTDRSALRVSEYDRPVSQNVVTSNLQGADRLPETHVFSKGVTRTTYYPSQTGASDGSAKQFTTGYTGISQPSIQLQFPCASLLGRSTTAAAQLEDCDPSSSVAAFDPPPSGVNEALAPFNWVSYTIAAYGIGTSLDDPAHTSTRLFVTTMPATLPSRRAAWTALNGIQAYPYGDPSLKLNYTAANFSWTNEPTPYKAADLGQDIKFVNGQSKTALAPSQMSQYQAPSSGQPRILLTPFARPARTTVVMTITDPNSPQDVATPAQPIAVLLPPPHAGGMGQDNVFTPTFGVSTSTTSGVESTHTSSVGTHVEIGEKSDTGLDVGTIDAEVGAGVKVNFSFEQEVERGLEHTVSVDQGSGYGGLFSDTVIVTRQINQYVWTGTVLHDPSGMATGQPIQFSIPHGEATTTNQTLSSLVKQHPELYGPTGAYGASLSRILGKIVVGDPSSYPPGADSAQPSTILASNGGACLGGYTPPTTLGDGEPVNTFDPRIPFIDNVPPNVTQPSLLVQSNEGTVAPGTGQAQTYHIGVNSDTTNSLLSTQAFNFGATMQWEEKLKEAVGPFEEEQTFTQDVGVDIGWSNGIQVTDTLGTGTSIDVTMSSFPFESSNSFGSWLGNQSNSWPTSEQYRWRMYLCKAQLGPAYLNNDVWVQGYVVSGYNGVGGLEDLSNVRPVSPASGAPTDANGLRVIAAATGKPSATPAQDCTGQGLNDFAWSQTQGTVRRYSLNFTDTAPGGSTTSELYKEWATPKQFLTDVGRGPSPTRPSCADVPATAFADNHIYSEQIVTTAFVPNWLSPTYDSNNVAEDYQSVYPRPGSQDTPIYVHAEVPPAGLAFGMVADPLVIESASGAIALQLRFNDPAGVTSLAHHVTIKDPTGLTVADTDVPAGTATFVTPALTPKTHYTATAYGYNDLGQTSSVSQDLYYDPFVLFGSWFKCGSADCNSDKPVQFTAPTVVSGQVGPQATANAVSWLWKFGDGKTSTLQNPAHLYPHSDVNRTYSVSLVTLDALGNATTKSGSLLIKASPRPTLSVIGTSVHEPKAPTTAVFTLRLAHAISKSVTVSFRTVNLTAVAGKDYRAVSGRVTFRPGMTKILIKVPILRDRTNRRNETFKLVVSAPSTLVYQASTSAICTILIR